MPGHPRVLPKPVPDPALLDPSNEVHRAWLRAFYLRLYCWYLAYVAPVVTHTAGLADDVDHDQAHAEIPRRTYQYTVTAIDHRTGEEVPVTVSDVDDAKIQRAFWYAEKLHLLPAEVEQLPSWLDGVLRKVLP